MPRIARFTISAIDALVRDLAYTPAFRRLAQIEAAEAFVREIDVNQIYPHDFVVWRLTGYRPDSDTAPAMHLGAALITDLVNFIQAVSFDIDIAIDHANRHALTINQAAVKMGVTDRTLRRYRKYGLVCHYICFEHGKRLGIFDDALVDFCADRVEGTRLSLASSFSRVSVEEIQAIISDARTLLESEELVASQVIASLAQKYNRSRETIRVMLQKAIAESGQPLLEQRNRLSEKIRRRIYQSWLRGTRITDIAVRYHRSAPAIHRLINSMRRTALVRLDLQWVELPTFDRDDADQTILQAHSVRCGLDDVFHSEDALEILDQARSGEDPTDDQAMAMIAAINWIKRSVCEALDLLPAAASSVVLDELETMLLWVSLLERRLTCLALPTAIRGIEQFLGQPVAAQSGPRLIASIQLATQVIVNLIHTIDPSRDQRLHRIVAQDIDRSLARGELEAVSGRAAVRHKPGTLIIPGLLRGLTPASRLVEPDQLILDHLDILEPNDFDLMQSRWGLGGLPPQTIVMLARSRGLPSQHLARHLQSLIQMLWVQV
jgi:DNA-binding transcriptional MerR regulator